MKFITTSLFVLSACLPSPWSAFAQAADPCTADRVMQRTTSDRHTHQQMFTANQDLLAVGDFDGDGSVEKAFFIRTVHGYSVVACLEDGRRRVTMQDLVSLEGYGITAAPPGIYLAACAIGYGSPCAPGQTAEVELPHDAVHILAYERSSWLTWWQNGELRRLHTSD